MEGLRDLDTPSRWCFLGQSHRMARTDLIGEELRRVVERGTPLGKIPFWQPDTGLLTAFSSSAQVQDFISSNDWLPNSPDLNPLVLKTKACSTQHRSLDAQVQTSLKHERNWTKTT
ncbi:unnamed protein product [Haemonchus placei]|uniref:Uncharacterized protein n=1 Tax=Haemonchus placei TaxID=6290 RepID=A0A0N4WHJ5_HAEPC|nr:unnamed protein product [Haemonchus placei]